MKEHFSLRLVLSLIAIVSIVMISFVAVRFYVNANQYEVELANKAKQVSQRIASAVAPSIWEIYQKSVDRKFSEEFTSVILDSELVDPYVMGIIVHGRFGHLYMGKIKIAGNVVVIYDAQMHQKIMASFSMKHTFPIKSGTMTIGSVDIYLDTAPLQKLVWSSLFVEFLQIGVISFLIIFGLYFTLRQSLLKPLESLEIAKQTFDCMDESIMYIDLDLKIMDVNPSFSRATGYQPKFIVNSHFSRVITESDNESALSEISDTLTHNESWSGEVICTSRSNRKFPASLTVTLVTNRQNKAVCFVYVLQDITEKKTIDEQLKKLAFFDGLTGLPNRSLFEQHLDMEIKRAERSQQMFGLLFLDLDDFKNVNDTLGHDAGDALLKEFSLRFKSRLRESDLLARLGGDEFTIIAPNQKSQHDMALLAEDLVGIANQPFEYKGRIFNLGASIGIAIYPLNGDVSTELLKNADIAMYEAKSKGRNQYAFYSVEQNQQVNEKLVLKNKIKQALIDDEFELYYQPKLHLVDRQIMGAEALIRWRNKEGDLVPPDAFIPLAEESHLIIEISNWVIDAAFAQLVKWRDTGFEHLMLSINLSARQLKDDSLVKKLIVCLEQTQVNPARLEVEITESSIITHIEESKNILLQIKALGISIAMDDFGTGYSSLAYLKQLPVDCLKIDRSFVSDLHVDISDASIVSTIILLAHSFNLQVVAEGIESEEHLNFLIEHQCEMGQGYYFSPPLPIALFEEFWQKLPS